MIIKRDTPEAKLRALERESEKVESQLEHQREVIRKAAAAGAALSEIAAIVGSDIPTVRSIVEDTDD